VASLPLTSLLALSGVSRHRRRAEDRHALRQHILAGAPRPLLFMLLPLLLRQTAWDSV